MSEPKKKILIIENEPVPFQKLYKNINRHLGKRFEIFPKIDDYSHTPLSYDYFLEKVILVSDTTTLLEYYKDIDLFIIDIILSTHHGIDGLEIEKLIKKTFVKNPREVLIVSNRRDSVGNHIWKGEERFENQVVKRIKKIYGIKDWRLFGGTYSYWHSLIENMQSFGLIDTIITVIKDLGVRLRQLIHMGIISVFYLLIVITGYYALNSMWKEFMPNNHVAEKADSNLSQASTVVALTHLSDARKVEETMVLEHAEKIFLYLLPIFIVFGFFNYYKTNVSVYFYDGNILPEDQAASVKSMNLTKSIFVSSIISFTLIKLIDELFFSAKVDVSILIASGVLLLLLMCYFILLNKHTEEDQHKK